MATSGSVDYNVTRDDIVNQTLELLNIISVGETPSGVDSTFVLNRLNAMVKHWAAQGLHLWSATEGTLFFADEIGEYNLSSASASARATKTSDAVITEVSTAVVSTDTAIVVDSTTGMTAADIVGIVMDDDTVHWSTIATVDSSVQITIDDATSTTAAADNNVYTFTTRIDRPLRILSARHVTGIGDNLREVPMTLLSKQEYFNIPNKNSNSTPTAVYYDPQLTTGKLYIWPRPTDPEGYLRFTYERTLDDFDAAANDPDFPQEWIEAIIYNLAVRIGPTFGRASDPNFIEIKRQAVEYREDALNWDNEVTEIQFMLD